MAYYSKPATVNNGEVADANDVNSINNATDSAFALIEADIDEINTNASYYAGLAEDWATKAEDSEVELGKYSALHHAEKASDSATTASSASGSAATAQGAAETAQSAAETAQGLAETAQGLAEDAQTAAETAQGLAETALTDIQVIEEEIDHVNSYISVANPSSPYTPDFPNYDTVAITGITTALTVDVSGITNGRTVAVFYQLGSGGSLTLDGGTKDLYYADSGLTPTSISGWVMVVLTGVAGSVFITFAQEFSI